MMKKGTKERCFQPNSCLCLDVRLEVVLDAAVDHLEGAAAARAGGAALNGLDGPVEAAAAGARVGAGSAALPLDVVGIAAAAAAENVGAAVARTH